MAALLEAFFGLIMAFLQALPAILEVLAHVAIASISIIAYAVSPSYRRKKRAEWEGNASLKWLHLGFSGVCLALLTSLGIWIALPTPPPKKSNLPPGALRIIKADQNEDLRFTLKSNVVKGATNDVTYAIKKGGISNIWKTVTKEDLLRSIQTNVVRVETNGIASKDSSN